MFGKGVSDQVAAFEMEGTCGRGLTQDGLSQVVTEGERRE
jgi:hypothetical protein